MSINTFDFLYLPRGAFIKFKGRRCEKQKEEKESTNNKIKAQRPKINEMANSLAKQLLLGNKEKRESEREGCQGTVGVRYIAENIFFFRCTSSEFLRDDILFIAIIFRCSVGMS
jgi:hypothetical protein